MTTGRVRAVARRTATVLCLLAVLIPAALPAAAGPFPALQAGHQNLDEVNRRLEETRRDLEGVERQRAVTIDDLKAIDAERARLDQRLSELGAELGAAEVVLADAEAQLAATTQELVRTAERLEQTRQEHAARQAAFAHRTRHAYMQGGGWSSISAVLDADDVAQLGRRLVYLQRILVTDRDQVTTVASSARRIAAETRQLEELRRQEDAARAVAARQRDRVGGLVAEQEQVRAQVVAQGERHAVVLARLESDRDTYLALVTDLETESQRITDELRRRADEERRRQAEEQRRVASRTASAAPDSQPGRMQRPAAGPMTSGYGWRTHPIFGGQRFHAGVDFGGGHGAPIWAAEAGVVVAAGMRGGYGNTVVLDHGSGLATLYAHQSTISVAPGQRVERGQVIGAIGSTGYSTGPHLHFEVRVNGQTRDPMGYL